MRGKKIRRGPGAGEEKKVLGFISVLFFFSVFFLFFFGIDQTLRFFSSLLLLRGLAAALCTQKSMLYVRARNIRDARITTTE